MQNLDCWVLAYITVCVLGLFPTFPISPSTNNIQQEVINREQK